MKKQYHHQQYCFCFVYVLIRFKKNKSSITANAFHWIKKKLLSLATHQTEIDDKVS